ncbi:hypothetical protein GEMRC1_002354 [Eukaryota sp. GEM-RC1]
MSSDLLPKPNMREVRLGDTITFDSSSGKRRLLLERTIGQGSFGTVYYGKADNGEPLALKKTLENCHFKNRELAIMRELSHTNVIHLKHWFYTNGSNDGEIYLCLIMEYLPETVYRIVRFYAKRRQTLAPFFVKLYAYQLLRSLGFLHSFNICHRDIKPQNLLVDPASGRLKLCDFGSAKRLVPSEGNVAYICSRYYRAPELIFGSSHYTTQVDVWSAGCVIAEMFLGQPVFPGESAVDQLVEIIKVLGTPSPQDIHCMNPEYSDYHFPSVSHANWSSVFRSKTPQDAIDLISMLLVYQPQKRLTAYEALAHNYFDELRADNVALPNGMTLPPLFDFSDHEKQFIGNELLAQIVPKNSNDRIDISSLQIDESR